MTDEGGNVAELDSCLGKVRDCPDKGFELGRRHGVDPLNKAAPCILKMQGAHIILRSEII